MEDNGHGYFKNDRYITRGVHESVPSYLIEMMWGIIDQLPFEVIDNYQFFNLSCIGADGVYVQVIEHHQDEPHECFPIMYIPADKTWSGTVYVIDNGEASVMCLPEER